MCSKELSVVIQEGFNKTEPKSLIERSIQNKPRFLAFDQEADILNDLIDIRTSNVERTRQLTL